jgi:hypothetical protein
VDTARRRAIAGAASLALSGVITRAVGAVPAPAELTPVAKNYSPAEQIMYATVLLSFPGVNSPDELKVGTGFFFAFFEQNSGLATPAIVSNWHVFDGADKCYFQLIAKDADGKPEFRKNHYIEVNDLHKKVIRHPDADLAILPAVSFLDELKMKGKEAFFFCLDQKIIPTEGQLKSLDAIESVITVGYPEAIWDNVNNLPIAHRGITATPPYVDYQGRPEFLVDFATLPGSSGSPMFLFDQGFWAVKGGGINIGGQRIYLLGVVDQWFRQKTGELENGGGRRENPSSPPAQPSPLAMNLGLCIRSSKILDFEPLMVQRGFKTPPGYVMRAGQ